MSNHAKHVAKHRGAPKRPAVIESPRRVARHALVMSSVAVAATGIAVAGGVLGGSSAPVSATARQAAADAGTTIDAAQLAAGVGAAEQRSAALSRSADRRSATDQAKAATLADSTGPSLSGHQDLADADPRDIARALLGQFGFDDDQFGCLDSLWTRESNWNVHADNPHSSAYGIPQSLPGSKMASAGPDWVNNPVTQITWGLGYIRDRYGSPCGAWGHSQSHGFY